MKSNMGMTDRIIRIIIAVVILVLYSFRLINGAAAIILLMISGIFILTSFISICPLYWLFCINTCKKQH